MKRIAVTLLCGSAFLASNEVSAAEEPISEASVSEDAYLQEFPIVLSASRLSQPLSESPNAMTVLDRQMIRASGFRSIADLFRLVPGMYVSNSDANLPIVSLNGVTDQYSRRMQVLIDGRSVYLPPFGGVAWQELPLLIEDIERIEVVRGPAAASYGSNSFYGVINIITRDGFIKNFKTVSATKGEMGISEVSARLGNAGENFDYRFSFGYRSDDGNNPQTVNDHSSDRLLNLRSNYRIDNSNSFEFKLGLGDRTSGLGTAGRFQDAFRDVSVKNDFQQLDWLHTWSSRDETKVTVSRTSRRLTDPKICVANQICIDTFGASGFGTEVANSQRQDIEVQTTTLLGANNRTVWGAGLRTDYAYQPLIFKTPITLHQSRIFAHDEWRVTESAVMNAGAMYEDDGAGHKNTSPRIALNYHVVPEHTLRAMVSSATRNPMMAEMYMSTAPQTYWSNGYAPPAANLEPEKIFSKEIGYLGQFGALSVDSRVYIDKVRNVIMVDGYVDGNFNSGHRTDSFKNLFEADYRGLDITTKYRWGSGNVTVNYSHQQASCAFSAYPTQYFSPIAGPLIANSYQTDWVNLCSQSVPADSGSILFDQRLPEAVEFSMGYYTRAKVRVTDVSSGYPPESPMRRVDMRIAKSFGQKEKPSGEIALVIQNAFQDNYTGYGNVKQTANLLFKRRAYLTASLNF